MNHSFEQSKNEIARLVKHFRNNREAYLASAYKEAHARQEFIDPLFGALNWDVQNQQHAAPDSREVIIEDSLDIEGQKKAPDYAFRLDRERKFFAEAKKPGVDIKSGAAPAYQLRRYAWSAKLPLSILTDFEELAVYDCRFRPAEKDKSSVARVNYFKCEEYAERWQEIWEVFSREAVLGGSFDQYAQAGKGKRGASTVDSEFLKEIEGWRESLARNIALRNPRLTIDELNDSVQRTIDRIIFLRMAEDRGIERYGQLQQLAKGVNIYVNLLSLSRMADAKYNSGLFDFSKAGDQVTPRLALDDKALRPILSDLYYPQSPYEFSVLPAEILGNVYEQFLGKVIRLTAGHQAKVEEKPEVKKAGGVYYTPKHIVDYIVKNTIGKQIEGKSPKQLIGFRVLDPACGSGSFLLGAYTFLLDYYRGWHTAHNPEKNKQTVVQAAGIWQLTLPERKRILIEHIFGVDIDRQAVEVTKLSLLLKVLEGVKQLALFDERALPNLDRNIKCGNSLIGPDYFSGKLIPDNDEMRRVNPFDWAAEFPEVARTGGFDCVIGNPPYLFITELEQFEKTYFFNRYETSEYRFDVYGLFTELAVQKLVLRGGRVGFIIPHTLLSNKSFEKLRRMILNQTSLELVVDIGPGVFRNAKNETMIFVARNGVQPKLRETVQVSLTDAQSFPKSVKEFRVDQKIWNANPGGTWLVNVSPDELVVVAKLEKSSNRLGNLCTINQGLRTGDNEKYLSASRKSGKWKPAAGGKNVGRYKALIEEVYVYYDPSVLDAPRKEEIFASTEKIVVQEIRNITIPRRLIATYDDKQFYCLQSTNVINLRKSAAMWSIKFLLGFVNSNAVNYFFRQRFSGNNHIASNQLAQIPLPDTDKPRHDHMVSLVEQMLDLHKRKAESKDTAAQERIQRVIHSTDSQIDRLVYELYGLSPEEIAVVENDAK